jgi:hypothetical protein
MQIFNIKKIDIHKKCNYLNFIENVFFSPKYFLLFMHLIFSQNKSSFYQQYCLLNEK